MAFPTALRSRLNATLLAFTLLVTCAAPSMGYASETFTGKCVGVTDGDTMFDVRFVRKVHRFDMVKEEEAAHPWRRRSLPKRARTFPPFDLSVIAGGNVVLREVVAAVGANVSVGSIVAIVTTESSIEVGVDDASGDFRTGIRPVAS